MPVVWIPSLLRDFTGGASTVEVPGRTLRQVINNLNDRYPGIKERLIDEDGQLHADIAAAIDGDTEHLGLIQPLDDNSEIQFVPAVSGGAPTGQD